MIFDKSTLTKRRYSVETLFKNHLKDSELLLICSGDPIKKPGGLDQQYPFLPHPDYYWISGLRRPWGVVAYSPSEGWVDFAKEVSEDEMVWEGTKTQIDALNIEKLESWITQKKFKKIYALGPHQHLTLSAFTICEDLQIQEQYNKARRIKDEAEIDLIRQTSNAALAGYRVIEQIIAPNISERDIWIEYERAALKAGAHKFPYETLVGSGKNSAILHASPSSKLLKKDELLLVDAGADIDDYCVDITRVYPVNGKFNSQQNDIYQIVLAAEKRGIEMCTPKTQWRDVHTEAARILSEGLTYLGIFKSSVDSVLESGAISVFFPHGVGHMVGLRVRDVGTDPTQPIKQYCGAKLRVDIPLEENFLMTVEPGIYFIEGLIRNPKIRVQYKDFIDWTVVEKWVDFGGIRIEDDILVKPNSPINLTEHIPKLL